jgi:membrane protein
MGAALSYYAMLSFVPLLLLLVTFASSLFSKDLVQGTLVSELSKILGTDAAHYIGEILRSRSIQGITLASTIITAAVTLFGALGVSHSASKS